MYSMPIHAVPKPASSTFRLVTDQSHGPFSLNSMIDQDKIQGFPLDNIQHLGYHLLHRRTEAPGQRRVLWKSDVSEAYRLMPMHPLWQIKQVNTLHGRRHVDRCNAFGGCASGGIWISFMALVMWIAREIERLEDVVGEYVDDAFGSEDERRMELYDPYDKMMPMTQVRLLRLWDKLGIPHKQKKQIWGTSLPIIGFDIDTITMTISLPLDKKEDLIKELRLWSAPPHTPGNTGSFNIRRWQQIAGWVNWALNAYPLLRPGLNHVYPKIQGRSSPFTQVYVNNAVRSDLAWVADHLEHLSGVQMLESIAWSPADADIVVFCDACLEGMGYWFPDFDVGFYAPTPNDVPSGIIFYFEALCVVSAISLICGSKERNKKVLVYTDNQNTVDIFSSLCCSTTFNHLLHFTVDQLLSKGHDLRVVHVSHDDNVIADAISRGWIGQVIDKRPNFIVHLFRPPHVPCYQELQRNLRANPKDLHGPIKSSS
ncbi:hypothetical protein BKA70DRAFT_1349139 [Coprinopsis sp. MPI-PUGE-AT-0042]|nr:hypothetical protein BKA70DRAFT_1349139 [Coprinopsis sp. MPI-PUGE-AT-0042]